MSSRSPTARIAQSDAEGGMAPQVVGYFDVAVAALPNESLIGQPAPIPHPPSFVSPKGCFLASNQSGCLSFFGTPLSSSSLAPSSP